MDAILAASRDVRFTATAILKRAQPATILLHYIASTEEKSLPELVREDFIILDTGLLDSIIADPALILNESRHQRRRNDRVKVVRWLEPPTSAAVFRVLGTTVPMLSNSCASSTTVLFVLSVHVLEVADDECGRSSPTKKAVPKSPSRQAQLPIGGP